MRVKSKWHNKKREKSIEEIAGVVAFNGWRIAQDSVNKMYSDGFNFRSNEQLLDTIGEFLGFFIIMADHWVVERVSDDAERQRFTNALALKLVDTMNENRVEELGPGDYREEFLERLNARLSDYSQYKVIDGEPSYPLLRLFGSHVESVMGADNKWVQEQVMEVETPAALKRLRTAFEGPFG
ncbi:hypothetical protein [Thiohalomonas denitrificans]|uniref:hypothetical protein n=1 Tax=Thiohalomonas denitrificans TaxID=415747 RepID=UPI0026F1931D|nr:hypothetical protein [Thiohalomonas denitrificans]